MYIYTQCPELDDETELCHSCYGSGTRDIGDIENGVWDTCPDCEGTGRITNDD